MQPSVEELGIKAEATQARIQAAAPLEAEDRRDVARQLKHNKPVWAQQAAELPYVILDRASVRNVLKRNCGIHKIETAVTELAEISGTVNRERYAGYVCVELHSLSHHLLGDINSDAL